MDCSGLTDDSAKTLRARHTEVITERRAIAVVESEMHPVGCWALLGCCGMTILHGVRIGHQTLTPVGQR
jgi:hypothetical protein